MIEHTDDPLIFNTTINQAKYAQGKHNVQHCPFCNVDELTGVLRTEGNKIWLKNKFPTIGNAFMTIIIESDKHDGDISTYSLSENREVFRFAVDCWKEMFSYEKYKSVLMFKNFGPRSGGTLRHPHLQIVGLESVDGYAETSAENFSGITVVNDDSFSIALSTRPVMGFVEFNVSIRVEEFEKNPEMADSVHTITNYVLTDYMNGRCDSYNLFFYHFDERYICKIVPRFITSPYFIGYKIPQVNKREMLEIVAEELRKKLN